MINDCHIYLNYKKLLNLNSEAIIFIIIYDCSLMKDRVKTIKTREGFDSGKIYKKKIDFPKLVKAGLGVL